MTELKTLLTEIDNAIAAAKPAFVRKLKGPASDAAIASLRTALGDVAPNVAAWFAWRNGSDDGAIPDTAWSLIDVDTTVREIDFLRSNPCNEPLPSEACPLMTDHGGGLWLYIVDSGEPTMWRYDRGDIVEQVPFIEWLKQWRDKWIAERFVVRVDFLRIGRSMMGWPQLEISMRSKNKVLKLLKELHNWPSVLLRDASKTVRIHIAPSTTWEVATSGWLHIGLPSDALEDALTELQKRGSLIVATPEEPRISFAEM